MSDKDLDHLNLASLPKFLKMLASCSASNERVLFSDHVIKINRKSKSQQRTLVITNRAIYNLPHKDVSKCKRRIRLDQLHHVSHSPRSMRFVLHITGEYDYYYECMRAEELVSVLQQAVASLASRSLEVHSVETNNLSDLVVTKKIAAEKGSWKQATPIPLGGKAAAAPAPVAVAAERANEENSSSGAGVEQGAESPAVAEGSEFTENKQRVSSDDFDLLKVLGKGSFGKVMLVRQKTSKQIFAMKTLQKNLVVAKNQLEHTRSERHTLEDVAHPFCVNLRFAFQTADKLYLVMDYCPGGELFFHLKRDGQFSERRARFYAAEIASALGHLHSKSIIYRDLKPENILLDAAGHIRLTDFGLAKEAMSARDTTNTFCGTPEYLAPEILMNEGHGKAVDWWSLGTLLFEMLTGLPPFYSENLNEMYRNILEQPLEFPPEVSPAAQDLLKGLLERDPSRRLGSGPEDVAEFKGHPFFKSIDWDALERREVEAPYKPHVTGEQDTDYFDEEFTQEKAVDSPTEGSALQQPAGPAFEGFTYVDKSMLS